MPKDWGYGNLSTWCLNGKTEPGDVPSSSARAGCVESIACMSPENGYGVQFLDGSLADMVYAPGELWQYEPGDGTVYPDGAWLGYQRSGDNLVLVVAPSRDEAETVLARWSGWVRTTRMATAACLGSGRLRRCPRRAGAAVPLHGDDGWLEQSELLTGQDAGDAVAALEAAPAAEMPSVPDPRSDRVGSVDGAPGRCGQVTSTPVRVSAGATSTP